MTEALDIQTQLQDKWMIFWWALGMSFLTIAGAWAKGMFKPFTSSFLPVIKGTDVLKGFGYFIFTGLLLIPFLVGAFYTILTGHFSLTPFIKSLIHFLMLLGGFLAVLLAYLQLTSLQRQQFWNQTTEPWYHHVLIGIAVWFAIFPVVIAFNQIISIALWHIFHHPFVEQTVVISLREAKQNPFLFGATVLGIITTVPFTEEFLFRGLLQNWLKQKFHSAWLPIALTSLVFALFHYTSAQGITNIELLASLFLLSCILGFIYERQRSLWASIGLHGFFNFMSLLMLFKEPS